MQSFGRNMINYRHLLVENRGFYLEYTTYFTCFRNLFNKTWDFIVFWCRFTVIERNIDFYNEFYVHIIVWIICGIIVRWNEHDFVFGVLQCILKCRYWLHGITMNPMLMLNMLRIKAEIVNVCMWNVNMLLKV